jgi:hypothetical protein
MHLESLGGGRGGVIWAVFIAHGHGHSGGLFAEEEWFSIYNSASEHIYNILRCAKK